MLLGLEPLSSHTRGNNGHTRPNYWISVPPTSGKHLSLENSTNIGLGSHNNLNSEKFNFKLVVLNFKVIL